ncbi:MAG: cupredoxin domain-containing protein [Nitrospiria bacterium]
MLFQLKSLFVAPLLVFPLISASLVTAEAAEVRVQLKEFHLEVSPLKVQAGKVRFIAVNRGEDEHELVVSIQKNGKYEEIDEIEPFPPGVSKDLILNLPAGDYELSCQVVEVEEGETEDHYKKGMHVKFKVN